MTLEPTGSTGPTGPTGPTGLTGSTGSTGAAVRCRQLVHVYRVLGSDVAALRGVDLEVAPGEQVALLGPSGSGKSTLLSVLAGIRRPSAGSVLIDGHDLARAPETELRTHRARTGIMLQGEATTLLRTASPRDCVALAAGRQIDDDPVLGAADLSDERRPVGRLGRSAQQATALAVAMVRGPRLLLADEPTSQLTGSARDRLLDAITTAADRIGATVVMVTHDEDAAASMQRMIRMREGRVGAEGLRHQQYAIVGADGSIQLPERLAGAWPAGSRVLIEEVGDRLQVSHRDVVDPAEEQP